MNSITGVKSHFLQFVFLWDYINSKIRDNAVVEAYVPSTKFKWLKNLPVIPYYFQQFMFGNPVVHTLLHSGTID